MKNGILATVKGGYDKKDVLENSERHFLCGS